MLFSSQLYLFRYYSTAFLISRKLFRVRVHICHRRIGPIRINIRIDRQYTYWADTYIAYRYVSIYVSIGNIRIGPIRILPIELPIIVSRSQVKREACRLSWMISSTVLSEFSDTNSSDVYRLMLFIIYIFISPKHGRQSNAIQSRHKSLTYGALSAAYYYYYYYYYYYPTHAQRKINNNDKTN